MKKTRSVPRKPAARKTKRAVKKATPKQAPAPGPVTLAQAQAIAKATAPPRAKRAIVGETTVGMVGAERKRLALQQRAETRQRVRDYKATLEIMKKRGVVGLTARTAAAAAAGAAAPLQVFAEGDSWFDYPVPFFGGSIIPRLQRRLGIPILNLAQAGDEVRFMLGLEQRKRLIEMLTKGCPAGGPWDVLLFSGGGNDIVGNPMALWIGDWDASIPIPAHINLARFDAALALVVAGYEDLIAIRDALSPGTRILFHAYDFAIPDGRGICHLGPWLKPTFELRKFPSRDARFVVVQAMLQRFAGRLAQLAAGHSLVTFINTQGTLTPDPSSWHNELHPNRAGFETFAEMFRGELKGLYPGRVV